MFVISLSGMEKVPPVRLKALAFLVNGIPGSLTLVWGFRPLESKTDNLYGPARNRVNGW
jgi:hypothetical protein